MTQKIQRLLLLVICVILFSSLKYTQVDVAAQQNTVHAVLFFSPTCQHCYAVINDHLPSILDKYGDQLNIIGINTSTPEGQAMYQAAIADFDIQEGRRGVPTLIIGNTILVGEYEIPTQLPALIEGYLEQGGVEWPTITGLNEFLSDNDFVNSSTPSPTKLSNWLVNFQNDITGNSFSIIMLVIMITSVIRAIYKFIQYNRNPVPISRVPDWVIPILSLIGLCVAGYLTYIETTNSVAFCGPVGDCNLVQQSRFSILFGIMPVGILGLTGYIFILSFWILAKYGPEQIKDTSNLILWALSAGGTLLSIYLTFLEPFVIGATCMWCITSSLVMTAIFWVMTPTGLSILLQSLYTGSHKNIHNI